jgi:hypothetical protein
MSPRAGIATGAVAASAATSATAWLSTISASPLVPTSLQALIVSAAVPSKIMDLRMLSLLTKLIGADANRVHRHSFA